MDYNLYPTIAVSDAVNSACCWTASYTAFQKGSPAVALGIGVIALASTVGTIRFGFAPKQFAYLNGLLASFGGSVGVPLIGFGFAKSRGILPDIAGTGAVPLPLTAVLTCVGIFSEVFLREQAKKLYTTLVCIVSMAALLHGESYLENPMALRAFVTFIFATVLIGNDRHKYTLGVRHENLFHYFLGTSMLLFAEAIGK